MSAQYVGVFHVLKDNVKEAWTQFWANITGPSELNHNVSDGGDLHHEREHNFRSRIKEKLERLKQKSIRIIDKSSNDQEDYSHLTRSKTKKELMQVSAAVMGIEFSYAAETAFVSPLLLNMGLRHRHMTLIWCLSPLLGFFLTPLLGSFSDGCKSQLGRRRPFILLLSIGIILGLILVPNGKTIGRMLGDTYRDDKLPDLKVPSELAESDSNSSLSFAKNLTSKETSAPLSSSDWANSSKELEPWNKTFSEPSQMNTSSVEEKLLYKLHSSKHTPTEYDDGFRARNSLSHKDKDLDRHEYFKTRAQQDKSSKVNQELEQVIADAAEDGNNGDEDYEISPDITNNEQVIQDQTNITSQQNADFRMPNDNNPEFTTEHMLRAERLKTSAKESATSNFDSGNEDAVKSHPWGLVFTVIGTVLLDFDADACQSPSRAYMLDVTIPEDHARGLSTFTIMAGLGGSIGYFLGALDWGNTFIGQFFGGHVRAVFTLVLFIFIACVIVTIRSFREIPIDRLYAKKPGDVGIGMSESSEHKARTQPKKVEKSYARFEDELDLDADDSQIHPALKTYGTIQETSFNDATHHDNTDLPNPTEEQAPTFREYVSTIVNLPKSLQWLCVTNFFCWMSLVCYSLYFTDFVGEAVFGGDPRAEKGTKLKILYDEGVRFGCWGMSLYSLSCSIYSLCIEALVNRFGARRVYIYGQLVYSVGMVFMALARHRAGVIIFSWTAGIMYATLFTMPYLLVARYHAAETFDVDVDDLMEKQPQMRGLGTDVAIVSSMVFLAQITQALTLGTIVTVVGSTTAIVCAAAVFASCGALCATKVLYLDL